MQSVVMDLVAAKKAAADAHAVVSDEDVHLAAMWVLDAMEGRPLEYGAASMVGRDSWVRRMYALNTAPVWEMWLQFLALGLMLRTFWEPALSVEPQFTCQPDTSSYHFLLEAVELCVLCCFWIDVYAKFVYMGRAHYFGKPWHSQYLVVVMLLTADALLAGQCSQRPFRFFRPFLIFYRNREQRRILGSLYHLVSHQLVRTTARNTARATAGAAAAGAAAAGAALGANAATAPPPPSPPPSRRRRRAASLHVSCIQIAYVCARAYRRRAWRCSPRLGSSLSPELWVYTSSAPRLIVASSCTSSRRAATPPLAATWRMKTT